VVSPFVRLMARASVRRDERPGRSHLSIRASRMDRWLGPMRRAARTGAPRRPCARRYRGRL